MRVVVVDDEPAMREVLEARLDGWGYRVRVAETVRQAQSVIVRFDPQVVISDLVLPDATGIELLRALKADQPRRRVVLISAYGNIDTAVEAMKLGACDFLTKPLNYSSLREILYRVSAEQTPVDGKRRPVLPSTRQGEEGTSFGPMVGDSPPQLQLYRLVQTVADSDATVLITGESGTGKELVAQTIHDTSPRRDQPFVPVNAAAIPAGLTEGELLGHERGAFTGAARARAGLFEQAHRGTLFLDEITDMPLTLQPKLLRVLENGRVRRLGGRDEMRCDVRVIAATNRDPAAAVKDGLLREDLFYRLNVFALEVAPLRQRSSDIPALVAFFLRSLNKRHQTSLEGASQDVLQALTHYHWPGNVRQLRNVLERAALVAQSGHLAMHHLPDELRSSAAVPDAADRQDPDGIVIPHGVSSAEAERILILETLRRVGNNKAEAARRLRVDVKTIRNKLKAFQQRTPE